MKWKSEWENDMATSTIGLQFRENGGQAETRMENQTETLFATAAPD